MAAAVRARRPGGDVGVEETRSLATVLFTDIVGSTQRAAEIGDQRWRTLLDAHDEMVRAELRRCRGREIKAVGDGFVAVFDSPGKAIRCALGVVERAHDLGVQIRAGVHTGEVELRGRDVGGIGVHIAARVANLAGADEILVSNTVKDLVAGSGFAFVSHGSHTLRGVPGKRRLFAVADPDAIPAPAKPTAAPPKRAAGSGTAKRKRAVKVLLADDHPLWRQTLRGVVEHGAAKVIAEAADGDEAVALARTKAPEVVVMDIDMPGRDGIEATEAISAELPDVKVLMLSAHKDRDQVLKAVRAGAAGYLLKTAGPAEITDAIARIHRGELAFPAELASVVLAELRSPAR